MKYILGISAFYHDSAAALLADGQVVAAAQEERFSRLKHDSGFPSRAINYVLNEGNIELNDLSAIIFYDKPLLKFERLLESYHALAPRGLAGFLKSIPIWMKEKVFFRRLLRNEFSKIGNYPSPILFCTHHLSHAASAFYPSPYKRAAILTIDGVGEWATSTIGIGDGHEIKLLRQLNFPHSVGLLYSAFTYYLGFRVNSGEYKLMGLAPYGNMNSDNYKRYKNSIESELVDIRPDGSILLNMNYFNFATGLTMTNDRKWRQIFGFTRREGETELQSQHMDMALAIQHVIEEIVIRMAKTARALTDCQNLVMAGGVALNCVANHALRKASIFEEIWVQPAAGDAGGAIGGALAGWHIFMNKNRNNLPKDFEINLGPGYSNEKIKVSLDKLNARYLYYEHEDQLLRTLAALLDQGNVIGWFQGRMEFGPRALGYRSILADPRSPEMQKRLNLKIKFREGFRPFAPVVLEEDATFYFKSGKVSPYMLFVDELKSQWRKEYPADSSKWTLNEKLYFQRSQLPAITHIDYTARIQTVSEEQNALLFKLLTHFKQLTGEGILINTSFNVRGEPIVCTPDDAYRCFLRTDMDYLAIGNFLLNRNDQNVEFISQLKGLKMEMD